MTELTLRYRLIWEGSTNVVRCCKEFNNGTVTRTNHPCFETDTASEIASWVEQENLIVPDTIQLP